mmetsp:Transcript_14420/g.20043  ORF Transcript_14420/g.20043 Transcript_14420/m.20043 type:complete len:113 (+) Transcript_14420:618-956(+)
MGNRSLLWHLIPSNHFPPWPPVQSRSTWKPQREQKQKSGDDKTYHHHRIIIANDNSTSSSSGGATSSFSIRGSRGHFATHSKSASSMQRATGSYYADWVLRLMRKEKSSITS